MGAFFMTGVNWDDMAIMKKMEELLALQNGDSKLVKLQREARDIPKRKALIDARLNGLRSELDVLNEEMLQKKAAVGQIEGEIESIKERVTKYRQQQFQIKSNDEYRALEKEIFESNKQVGGLEEREIQALDEVEAIKVRVAAKQEELDRDQAAVQDDLIMMDQRAAKLTKRLTKLIEARKELMKSVDPNWLRRYERILKHVGDAALVPIENGACGGCHMTVPPQLVRDAIKEDSLTFCGFCGRILYRPSV